MLARKRVSAALDVLHVVGVDAVRVQDLVLGLAEVVADRADHADVREVAGRQREVHGRAAEHPLALAEGGLDRVEGDRSNHGHRHGGREASE